MRDYLKPAVTVLLFIDLIMVIHSCQNEEVPSLTTSVIMDITGTTATSGGTITDGGSGRIVSRGVCWSTDIRPTISDSKTDDGAGSGTFTSTMSGLNGATTYYVRAYAINNAGTGYGMVMLFSTLGKAPTTVTQPALNVTTVSAMLNGSINPNYLPTSIIFDYGTTITYGSSIAATPDQVTGDTLTNVTANISGLTPETTYHFRIKAINSLGTIYGNDLTFTTLVADIDGNGYNIVTIGTQIWMKENLKVTKYRNGDLIGTTIPATLDISGESTPKYQWAYDGNESNAAIYGRLYTWYVITDVRYLCPAGWHVPGDTDWTTLTTYLNGETVAGGKLKETGIAHWTTPNTGATNVCGFTALPGGTRTSFGTFSSIGDSGFWWSTTENNISAAWDRSIDYNYNGVNRINYGKRRGFSVRCIKDN